MAILKANGFEIELTYVDLNNCAEIIYGLKIRYNEKEFFNPQIIDELYQENQTFLFSDCEDSDWLMIYLINILQTKKGRRIETLEPPHISFDFETWENIREEREKSWEGKTCKTLDENGEIIDEPYAETMKIFIPLWENNIDVTIGFPSNFFKGENGSSFTLTARTTFSDFTAFLTDLSAEMRQFFNKNKGRVKYLGSGKYEELQKN